MREIREQTEEKIPKLGDSIETLVFLLVLLRRVHLKVLRESGSTILAFFALFSVLLSTEFIVVYCPKLVAFESFWVI
mgnify:CR=1 FL=1